MPKTRASGSITAGYGPNAHQNEPTATDHGAAVAGKKLWAAAEAMEDLNQPPAAVRGPPLMRDRTTHARLIDRKTRHYVRSSSTTNAAMLSIRKFAMTGNMIDASIVAPRPMVSVGGQKWCITA
jgi:hypothetical protein